MQKAKTSSTGVVVSQKGAKRQKITQKISKCSFYSKEKFENLKNEIISEIHDIEDLVKLGSEMKICPYFSSKESIDDAHVVLLPYQMLLNNKIRQQFNINLKDNIVIIDEAHNLLDTLTEMHSAMINLNQLEICLKQLKSYLDKYINRMKGSNIVQFNKLIFIIERLRKLLEKWSENTTVPYRMLTTIDLMYEGEFPNFNILEILKFCNDTRLPDKVHGFARNYKPPNDKKESSRSMLLKNLENSGKIKNKKKVEEVKEIEKLDEVETIPSVIRPILRFLECLTDCSEAGGILFCCNEKNNIKTFNMKFMLLKPDENFKDILENSRSVSFVLFKLY